MFATTLKTEVLKTVTVTGVKLAAPADRIGQGLSASRDYPMDNLSPEHVSVLDFPEPKQAWEQSLSQSPMRQQTREDERTVPPASWVGCPSAPGFAAARLVSRVLPSGWPCLMPTNASGRTTTFDRDADLSRTHGPGNLHHVNRPGSDCQSPSRTTDFEIAIREVSSATAAKK